MLCGAFPIIDDVFLLCFPFDSGAMPKKAFILLQKSGKRAQLYTISEAVFFNVIWIYYQDLA